MDSFEIRISKDRDCHGQFVRITFICKTLAHLEPKSLECICLESAISNKKIDLIQYSQTTQFSKYRPLFNEFSAAKVINQIKTLKIFMRDFNIDIIISNSDHDKLEQFCSLFNLKSFIKKETCITKLHVSTIDLIIKNKPLSFQNSSFIKTG